MKLLPAFLIVTLLALPAPCFAQWRDKQGNALPETEQMQEENGFVAMLLITDDQDWESKWNTPPETTPEFRSADKVRLGGELNILTVLANPTLDAKHMADVRCDIRLTRPDGSFSLDLHGEPCFQGEVQGNPYNLRMTRMSLKFLSEAGDQKGKYTVQVTLHDKIGGTSLTLTDSFTNE